MTDYPLTHSSVRIFWNHFRKHRIQCTCFKNILLFLFICVDIWLRTTKGGLAMICNDYGILLGFDIFKLRLKKDPDYDGLRYAFLKMRFLLRRFLISAPVTREVGFERSVHFWILNFHHRLRLCTSHCWVQAAQNERAIVPTRVQFRTSHTLLNLFAVLCWFPNNVLRRGNVLHIFKY